MISPRRLVRMQAVLSLSVAGVILATASPAMADGTSGSFCYESAQVTATSSKVDASVTYTASVTYRPLRNCSGTQVGIHVISSRMAYTRGFNGTDPNGGKHGMTQTGLSYMTCSSAAGDEIYAGSVFAVGGYPRGYTYNANKYIYSGTGHNDHGSFSFADTAAFGYFKGPYGGNGGAPSENVWYIPLRNQWKLCEGVICGWGACS